MRKWSTLPSSPRSARSPQNRAGRSFTPPSNLAKPISIEAAELLEHYQRGDDAELAEVRDELADVLTYCYQLAMRLDLDPDQIVLDKLRRLG